MQEAVNVYEQMITVVEKQHGESMAKMVHAFSSVFEAVSNAGHVINNEDLSQNVKDSLLEIVEILANDMIRHLQDALGFTAEQINDALVINAAIMSKIGLVQLEDAYSPERAH
jgi:hypothetical protein